MRGRRGLAIVALLPVLIAVAYIAFRLRGDGEFDGAYAPQIEPSNFTPNIENRFLTLSPGRAFVYEGRGADGPEKTEIVALRDTKQIMGVETRVVRDRTWVNGVLVEDTRDYFAQDSQGDVWYFGEDVDNYEGGRLKDHAGSWIAGVDGALPGILVRARPRVGEAYRQEYYPSHAEDIAKVLSISESVSVRGRQYSDCLKTLDTSLVEKGLREHKYYCPEAGAVVLVVDLAGDTREELVEIRPPS